MDGEVAIRFLAYVANILEANRLLVTMQGRIGLTPGDIKGGDFVAIVNGLPKPYVVRARNVKSKGNAKWEEWAWEGDDVDCELVKMQTFQVVGPCYLHGMMKGEVFRSRDAPQFSHSK